MTNDKHRLMSVSNGRQINPDPDVDCRRLRSSSCCQAGKTGPNLRRETMRVMVLVKATADSEKGFALTPEMRTAMEAMGRFNEELSKAGILVAADGLTPSSQGKRVAFD